MATQVMCPADEYRARRGNEPKHAVKISTSTYTPIADAQNNAKVIALTKWAIDEKNKEIGKPGTYKFREVDSASYSTCDMTYYIKFQLWTGCLGRTYEAKVWDESWTDSKKLVEFKKIK